MRMIQLHRNSLSSAFGAFVVHLPQNSEHVGMVTYSLIFICHPFEVGHTVIAKHQCTGASKNDCRQSSKWLCPSGSTSATGWIDTKNPETCDRPPRQTFQHRLLRVGIQILTNIRQSRNLHTRFLRSRLIQYVVTSHRIRHTSNENLSFLRKNNQLLVYDEHGTLKD